MAAPTSTAGTPAACPWSRPAPLAGRVRSTPDYLTRRRRRSHPVQDVRGAGARDSGSDRVTNALRAGRRRDARRGLDSDEQPISSGGAILAGSAGRAEPAGEGGMAHPISVDGSRIFFEAPIRRLEATRSSTCARTGRRPRWSLPPSARLPGNGPLPVRFEGAAADGSLVYFRTGAQLVDDRQRRVHGPLSLRPRDARADPRVRGQQGAEGAAASRGHEDSLQGSAASSPSRGRSTRLLPLAGRLRGWGPRQLNLYLYDGESQRRSGALGPSDDFGRIVDEQCPHAVSRRVRRSRRRPRRRPDGSVLVVRGDSALTRVRQHEPACRRPLEREPLHGDLPLRRATDEITCLSCNPTGTPPLGPARLPVGGRFPRPGTPLPRARRLARRVRDRGCAGARGRQRRERTSTNGATGRSRSSARAISPRGAEADGDRPRRRRLALPDRRPAGAPGHRQPHRPLRRTDRRRAPRRRRLRQTPARGRLPGAARVSAGPGAARIVASLRDGNVVPSRARRSRCCGLRR